VILNSVIQAERSKYLQTNAWEQAKEVMPMATHPKTISTKSGEIIFAIPQVQEGGFYPSAMEKGMIR
jgi:putative transposase